PAWPWPAPTELRQQAGQLVVVDAAERPAAVAPGQHGDLELTGFEGAVGTGERAGGRLQGVGERHRFADGFLESIGDGLRLSSEDGEPLFVDHRAVVEDVVQLVLG